MSKNSLAVAYSVARHAKKKRTVNGGEVEGPANMAEFSESHPEYAKAKLPSDVESDLDKLRRMGKLSPGVHELAAPGYAEGGEVEDEDAQDDANVSPTDPDFLSLQNDMAKHRAEGEAMYQEAGKMLRKRRMR